MKRNKTNGVSRKHKLMKYRITTKSKIEVSVICWWGNLDFVRRSMTLKGFEFETVTIVFGNLKQKLFYRSNKIT